ncbi:4Fe-4S binding protein [Peptoniphilus harei]|uniref:4Fe-4S binding protein n=1 Tax=Peptoniphilus harei TaxID=54005 RepID=UPI003908B5CD
MNCGICVSKCPTGAIYCEYPERVEKMKQKEKEKKEKERQAKIAEAQAKKAAAEKTNA